MTSSLSAVTSEKNTSTGRRSLGADWMLLSSLLLVVLSLGGCDRDSYLKLIGYDRASLMKKMTPQDDESLAKRYMDLLRQSRFEKAEEGLDPGISDGAMRDKLAAMAGMFPTREPLSIKTVDTHVLHGADFSTTSITLEYEFAPAVMPTGGRTELSPRSWLLAEVVIGTRSGVKSIAGLHVMPISESVEDMNEFTFVGKGISQYAALCLVVLVLAFSLYALVLCIRTKIGKSKWIWMILIIIGVCRVSLNWATGQWFFTPLAIQVPPVNASCSPYGPWIVQITVPLGAIAFLLLRKSLTARLSPSAIQSPTLAE